MLSLKRLWKPYRPWHIIGENGGQVPVERQWRGLSSVDMTGRSVLDVGCAEGMVSLKCHEAGAAIVHGVELRERAVEVARSLAGDRGIVDQVKFFQGDLSHPEQALNQPGMRPRYDIVLANAVIQKVGRRASRLLEAVTEKCDHTLVIRLPERRVQTGRRDWVDPVARCEAAGFRMLWESCGYPQGEPPYPLEGEAWLAVFERS